MVLKYVTQMPSYEKLTNDQHKSLPYTPKCIKDSIEVLSIPNTYCGIN